MPMSKAEFRKLTPRQRGYATYMMGARKNEPNVPDEACPYPAGSKEAKEWNHGQDMGVQSAQDSEE